MSIFKIYVLICKAIEQKIAAFYRRNNRAKLGIHQRKWEVLKTSKDDRGLGLWDLLTFNKIMLRKQAWRMAQDPSSVWCQLTKGVCFSDKDFRHAEKGTTSSRDRQSLVEDMEAIANLGMLSAGYRDLRLKEWTAGRTSNRKRTY